MVERILVEKVNKHFILHLHGQFEIVTRIQVKVAVLWLLLIGIVAIPYRLCIASYQFVSQQQQQQYLNCRFTTCMSYYYSRSTKMQSYK